MTIRKRSNVRLRVIFYIIYVLIFALFIFIWPKVLRSYLTPHKTISPLSKNQKIILEKNNTDKSYKDLVKSLTDAHISFMSISKASDSAYIVRLTKDKEVIFSKKLGVSAQVSSLQLIQSRLTIEGKDFSRLDFRFSNPIIVLK